MFRNRENDLKDLVLPLYEEMMEYSDDRFLQLIRCMCTQLRLGQRDLSVVGVPNSIGKDRIQEEIDKEDNVFIEKVGNIVFEGRDIDIVVLYVEKLYYELLVEVMKIDKNISPELYYYICTKLFGYDDFAYKWFLRKWIYGVPAEAA
ncbi:MAG: hypothetical protein GY861_22445 [bacterium]|nr:hypothetical protein [bacterium]